MKNDKLERLKQFGFSEEAERIEKGLCPICFCKINKDEFKDKLSIKEFEISGLCQKCQDKIFKIIPRE